MLTLLRGSYIHTKRKLLKLFLVGPADIRVYQQDGKNTVLGGKCNCVEQVYSVYSEILKVSFISQKFLRRTKKIRDGSHRDNSDETSCQLSSHSRGFLSRL